MGYVKALKCKECGREYNILPVHVCEFCFGALDVVYDYEEIRDVFTKDSLAARPKSMWRYKELLPLDGEPSCGLEVGFTPLVRARRLEKFLGVKELYIKNDAVNYPTLSFKDRVVAVAISKAKEFGYDTVACASTGNLANSLAALSSSCGLKSYIFVPWDLEQGKILGTIIYGSHLVGIKGNYDQVNRLCSEIAENYNWAFVNINLRPFYAEGSKTYAFEIAEQLNFKVPDNIVVPMGGGSLITKVWKGLKELELLGFIDGLRTRVHGAQPKGSNPIVSAFKENLERVKPVKPRTIAKSLAIGNPADGIYALRCIRDSGGYAEDVEDEEIVDAIKLLAREEGIFTEPAGGVTLAATIKLLKKGIIGADESVLVCITGNGLKTQEVINDKAKEILLIDPTLNDFENLIKEEGGPHGQYQNTRATKKAHWWEEHSTGGCAQR